MAARSKGSEAAQLLDEGREGHVEVERGAERAGSPARRLLHVDPPPELVAEPLRFDGALAGGASLAAFHLDESPDDAAERERDQPPEHHRVDLGRDAELGLAERLDHDDERQRQRRGDHAAEQAEEERRLEHDEVGQGAKRLTGIPGVDSSSAPTRAKSAATFSTASRLRRPCQLHASARSASATSACTASSHQAAAS